MCVWREGKKKEKENQSSTGEEKGSLWGRRKEKKERRREGWARGLGRTPRRCFRAGGWGRQGGGGAASAAGRPRSLQVYGMRLEPPTPTSGKAALPLAEGKPWEALGSRIRQVPWAVIRGSLARSGRGCEDQPGGAHQFLPRTVTASSWTRLPVQPQLASRLQLLPAPLWLRCPLGIGPNCWVL